MPTAVVAQLSGLGFPDAVSEFKPGASAPSSWSSPMGMADHGASIEGMLTAVGPGPAR